MTETPSVAIVIPALNEADNLGDLLDDCAAQEIPGTTEVIVVDAGSDDGTPELVERHAQRRPGVRLVRAAGALPGAARNAGIEKAGAGTIATLDAGRRGGPDWLPPARAGGGGRDPAGGGPLPAAPPRLPRA